MVILLLDEEEEDGKPIHHLWVWRVSWAARSMIIQSSNQDHRDSDAWFASGADMSIIHCELFERPPYLVERKQFIFHELETNIQWRGNPHMFWSAQTMKINPNDGR